MLQPAVQWLFLDLNAFFASCEQQEAPALRGKPIIVVQTLTDSAGAIAAKNNDPSLIEPITLP
jgi:DNA polymerase-4